MPHQTFAHLICFKYFSLSVHTDLCIAAFLNYCTIPQYGSTVINLIIPCKWTFKYFSVFHFKNTTTLILGYAFSCIFQHFCICFFGHIEYGSKRKYSDVQLLVRKVSIFFIWVNNAKLPYPKASSFHTAQNSTRWNPFTDVLTSSRHYRLF